MATSGTFGGLDTASQIVQDALIELGVYSANQQLRPSDGELGRRRLNYMLKEWQDDGVNLWRQSDVVITWPADTAEANLEDLTSPLDGANDIIDLQLVVSPTYDRPLYRKELAEYRSYPNKTTPGQPTIYAVSRELDKTRLRLWPVATADITLKATVDRRIEDVANLTNNLDVPQRYTRAVMLNLASVLAAPFGRASDPNCVVTIREAARLYQLMRANDRPASYFMTSAGARYGV